MISEKGPPLPGQNALEQSKSPDQELANKIQQIAAEAQVKLKEPDVTKILAEIAEKRRLAEARKKDSGQEQEFSEEGYIKSRIENIKEGEEFLKTYLDALGVFEEICPGGEFHSFDMENPFESLRDYTEKKRTKEAAKSFFPAIADRLKTLKETLGAPIKEETRCFIVREPHGGDPYVKELAISKIDENGKVRFIWEKGTYTRKLFKSAEDAIRDIQERHPKGKELGEIKIERLPE